VPVGKNSPGLKQSSGGLFRQSGNAVHDNSDMTQELPLYSYNDGIQAASLDSYDKQERYHSGGT
jgi:hypothetical protein